MSLKSISQGLALAFLATTFATISPTQASCFCCDDSDDESRQGLVRNEGVAPQQLRAPLVDVYTDNPDARGREAEERESKRKEEEARERVTREKAALVTASVGKVDLPAAAAASVPAAPLPVESPARGRASSLQSFAGDPIAALQPRYTSQKIENDLWELLTQNGGLAKAVAPHILAQGEDVLVGLFNHNADQKNLRLSINGKRGPALIKYGE